jgi:LysM repeat protein
MRSFRIAMVLLAVCFMLISTAGAQDNSSTISHTVSAGETIYSIARKYKVDVKAIFAANGISDKEHKVKIGDVILVPAMGETENTTQPVPVVKDLVQLTTHLVKQGETLNKIAQQYNTTPEVIRQLNGLTSDGINIAQILKVPANGNADTPKPTIIDNPVPPATPSVEPITADDKKDINSMKAAYATEYNENEATYFDKGMAMWIDDSNEDTGSRFYALHKSAPAGTILKVRNLMNDKVAYVKVVGKLPDIAENNNVIVKVSGATAKYLEVIDPKFLVEISYVNKKN